jgi:hypothetical protein
LSSKRNERLVENETTPLLAAESSCLLTEQNTTQSECLLTEQGGSWMRRVWRLALEALVSIYLGLIQVLGLMIRCKKRDAKSGAKQKHTSTEAKAVPEDFLLVDIFATCLTIIPADDWCRTWAADRTIMLRITSKRFKELVDKMRPPVAVRWRMSFLEDERNGTAAEKLRLIFRQLAAFSARSRITTLELCYHGAFTYPCRIKGQDAERLAGVLAQCPALAHLNLGENQLRTGGAENLAGELPQCRALTHLDLSADNIGDSGAESLARVLAQCPALNHLSLAVNQIGEAGAESLAGVLGQCPTLTHLNLSHNGYNYSGGLGAVGSAKLRASWLGRTSGLLL